MTAFKILGTSTDVTECEVCGKVELKGTVALVALDADGNEDGEAFYAGTTCAARKVGAKSAEVRGAVKVFNTRFQVARSNFTDYFRGIFGCSLEEFLSRYPKKRTLCEAHYRKYMEDAGFSI